MSTSEEIAAATLRRLLVPLSIGDSIPDSDEFRDLQSALESLLPSLLAERHAWWRHESIDGFRFCLAQKRGPEEAVFVGLGLLITDQTWTPMRLTVRVSTHEDALATFDLCIGEAGPDQGGMIRTPYGSSRVNKRLHSLAGRVEQVSWAYSVSRDQV